MRTVSLIAIALLFTPSLGLSDEQTERDRRAKAALAIAKSMPSAPTAVAVAPEPHKPEPKSYAAGAKESVLDQSPLVVYVACAGPKIDGAVTCEVPGPTFGPVTGPAVVVGFPKGDRLYIDATLPCPAKPGEIEAAVKAAAKKIDTPAKNMPPAPPPLNTQIRAGCVCGDSCQCPAGKCPGGCPVATKPALAAATTPVLVGYQRVCSGGVCQLVPVYR